MSDYRAMFDRDYIGAWDLAGKDITVTIARVEAKKLTSQRGTNLKPIVWFEGKEKGFVCNKTNAKTIAAMYGNDTANWIGKRITIFPTTTSAGGETVDCIRVRPKIPTRSARGNGAAQPSTVRPDEELPKLDEPPADWKPGDAYEGPVPQ